MQYFYFYMCSTTVCRESVWQRAPLLLICVISIEMVIAWCEIIVPHPPSISHSEETIQQMSLTMALGTPLRGKIGQQRDGDFGIASQIKAANLSKLKERHQTRWCHEVQTKGKQPHLTQDTRHRRSSHHSSEIICIYYRSCWHLFHGCQEFPLNMGTADKKSNSLDQPWDNGTLEEQGRRPSKIPFDSEQDVSTAQSGSLWLRALHGPLAIFCQ